MCHHYHVCLFLLLLVYCITCLNNRELFQNHNQYLRNKKTGQHNLKYVEKLMEHVAPQMNHGHGFSWDKQSCLQILTLMQKKTKTVQKISNLIEELKYSKQNLTKVDHIESPAWQVPTLEIFVQELNETELFVIQSIQWLEKVLGGDYSSLLSLTANAWNRLESLRQAALKLEQEYISLLRAKKNMLKANHTHAKGIIDNILHEVSDVADKLEANIDEHLFKDALNDFEEVNADNIETVLRLPYDKSMMNQHKGGRRLIENIRLVDPDENQFVLSKPKDATIPHEDIHLIQDMIYLWIVATVCGWICFKLNLPEMIGYVFSGILLGPAFLNIIQCTVQVETFGEFGVFFTLFSVGLEFSITIIKRVLKIAVLGTLLVTILLIMLIIILGFPWQVSVSECVFVASCLSLSSSSLVVRFVDVHSDVTDSHCSDLSVDYHQILIGILITQKIYMGTLMALLPKMASHSSPDAYAYMIVCFNLIIVFGICWFIKVLMTWLVRKQEFLELQQKIRLELIVISTASLLFLLILITNYLHLSMELGCLLAGVIFNLHDQQKAKETYVIIQPIKHVLGCLFFASIGLHVYPQFFILELTIILMLTVGTIFMKYVLYMFTVSILVRGASMNIRWLVPAGLAQVSEFSFILASRARNFNLISREVYLLILGVTLSSLLIAPFIWNISFKYVLNRKITSHLH